VTDAGEQDEREFRVGAPGLNHRYTSPHILSIRVFLFYCIWQEKDY
jgi:hypothetical protein